MSYIAEHVSTQRPLRPSLSPQKGFRAPSYGSPSSRTTRIPEQIRATSSSRKRPRSTTHDYFTTPQSCNNDIRHRSTPLTCESSWDNLASPVVSPPPLINMQYRYAGGLNTPGAEAASRLEEDDDFERDFRRRRTTWKEATPDSGRQVFTVGGLSRERNGGRKRGRQSSVAALDQSESWSSYVARVAGGIAGAVWTFCSDTAFTGFKAGGGVTYDWQSMHTPRHDGHTRGSTPIPGQFPEDYEAVDENSPSADMEGRPAKRRQTTQGSNDDWVMVGGAGSSHNNASSTSYAKPSSAPALAQRSRLPRYSPSSRPSLDRQPRPHASTARLIASGTPPHAHKPSHPSRAASYASPRASLTAPRQSHTPKKLSPNNKSSPLPAELEEFTKQRDREDHQADARMRRMNKQLKAMIAEGQQALAFKFEATGPDDAMEGHLEDEGYGEGYASDDLAGLNAKLI